VNWPIDLFGTALLVLAIVLMAFLHTLISLANRRKADDGVVSGHLQSAPPVPRGLDAGTSRAPAAKGNPR
jgi:hypothetical protein